MRADTAAQPFASVGSRERTLPAALLIFFAALAPRALVGSFLTVDEAYHWFGRVERFVQALAARDWAGTNLIGHPGVTTLWLGAAGSALHGWLVGLGALAPDDGDAHRTLLRLPVALVTAGCVALSFLLLRRLMEPRVALLAALLMAGEPFLVAHSQLLHLDALLTSLMTVSVLAALVAAFGDRGRRTVDGGPEADGRRVGSRDGEPRSTVGGPPSSVEWRWWLLSAVFGGLALLTKSPAIFLLPMLGLVVGVGVVAHAGGRLAEAFTPRRLALGAGRFALWCLAAGAVWLALWPAAWVDPGGAMRRVALQASADGGAPHGWGNFFLGRAVADPGPLFYPVTLAFRLAPWTLVGLILAAAFVLWDLRRWGRGGLGGLLQAHAVPLLLGVFVVGFTVALSLSPKKFDRYALPVVPALDILAALGLVRLAAGLARAAAQTRGSATALVGLWSVVAGLLAANLAWSYPYHLAYFNPLLGGGTVAARVVPVGWGEGYEQAAEFIAAQYNGADRPTAARYEPVLGPFLPGGAAPLAWWQTPGRVDYAVVYVDQVQREEKPETFRPLLETLAPIHTVRINGIDYAYVFQIPPPVPTPLAADFGEALHLRGFGLDASQVRAGTLTLRLEWQARRAPAADYVLFAHVFDARGERVASVDVPPGDARAPTGGWEPGRYVSLVQPIPLPPDLPAGAYRVAIGVYDPHTGARLPLRAGSRPSLPAAGADALMLTTFELR